MMHSMNTITRVELINTVYSKIGLSKADSGRLVESTLESVCKALEGGENVKLSAFGSFNIRDKNQRVGRNPKTGIEVPITPRRVVTFRASPNLKQAVNSGAGAAA
ncbi:MAG: integration host factor subunit alpha [Alphaproteobacteria bacterium]|jgi:integration host factor subunit alpha|nr:integration host factor subunit alpha [Alphaproteobacteria bacterium]